ncbi:hypothetical protein SAMN05421544_101189 [Riemerella columbipharyngis]|uniref:Uncharacterized protein n=2 Tax=Riemerella columbipharyngis TaxID=1071918 RepID=A0A1G6YJZ9_9FLAO|nr:hypothetical protein SAMN05421544_101189 [Riemerella columbipharyngis]
MHLLGFSQVNRDDVISQFRDYKKMIAQQNFEEALDKYTPENVFSFISKEKLIKSMKERLSNPQIKVDIYEPTDIHLRDQSIKVDETDYIIFSFTQYVGMTFKDKSIDLKSMIPVFETKIGKGNVTYDEKLDCIKLKSNRDMVASSKDGKNWKFIMVYQSPHLRKVLPKEVLNQLNLK